MKYKTSIIIGLLILVACQTIPITPRPGPAPEIYTGTSALEASFTAASINDILMCKQSNVFVSLRNLGTFDIDGTYTFIVEDQYLTPVGERQKDFELEGKSEFLPKGSLDQIAFEMKNPGLPAQHESYFTNVIFQACYPYKTFAGVSICIDPDIQNLNRQKPCYSETITLSGGQGAPVAVTRVEPLMVPDEDMVSPMFSIYVSHLGTGQVITTEGADAACKASGTTGTELLSLVNVRAQAHNIELECTPNPVRLRPGEETRFICEHPSLKFGAASGTFSTLLSIELEYGYVNTAVLPVTITRLQGQKVC